MKNIFLLILVAIATISCSKDEDPIEPAPTIQLTISNTSIPYSTAVTINWTTTNAKSVSINGENMTTTSGTKTYSNLITTTKFTALATNVTKTATVEKTVIVGEEPAPTVTLTVSPNDAIIPYSTSVTISWSSNNATKVSINGESMTSTSGSKTYSSLITTTIYTALATNVVKTATDSKTVTVAEEPTPTATLTISPNDAVLPYGKDITVSWNITNFKTATLNGEAINTATGSKEFKQLLATTDFTIVVTNFTKSVTTKKTVMVGDWKSSRFGLISHGYWRNTKVEFYTKDNRYIDKLNLLDTDLLLQWFFSENGTYDIFNPDGTRWSTGASTPWRLDSDSTHIILGGTNIFKIFKIVECTPTSFIFQIDILWGTPQIHIDQRFTFER